MLFFFGRYWFSIELYFPPVLLASRLAANSIKPPVLAIHTFVMNGAASPVMPIARELRASLINSRLSVWWEGEEAWYTGTVRAFSDALGEHLVCYDDGEQRHELLDKCS